MVDCEICLFEYEAAGAEWGEEELIVLPVSEGSINDCYWDRIIALKIRRECRTEPTRRDRTFNLVLWKLSLQYIIASQRIQVLTSPSSTGNVTS